VHAAASTECVRRDLVGVDTGRPQPPGLEISGGLQVVYHQHLGLANSCSGANA
jgi:hypothetical protein